jgi:hypothetical protein
MLYLSAAKYLEVLLWMELLKENPTRRELRW